MPTLGSFYVAVTLLFPFVAIRALGQEKETGALRLLVQLPYRPSTLVSAKLAAVLAAWMLASVPALSALVSGASWGAFGCGGDGKFLFGHLVYGLLVGALALFSASIAEARLLPRLSRLPSRSGHGFWISPSPAVPGYCHGSRSCR